MRMIEAGEPYEDTAELVAASLGQLGKPTLLLLSGGSACHMYPLLAERLGDCQQLTVSLIDERYNVNPRHANSNSFQIGNTGLPAAVEGAGGNWQPVLHGASREDEVTRFAQLLGDFMADSDCRVIAVLGIGPDGHTAGMLPDADADRFQRRFEGADLAVGYNSDDKYRERITTTITALRQVDETFVIAADPEKANVLSQVTAGKQPLNKLPATIVQELENVTLITSSPKSSS